MGTWTNDDGLHIKYGTTEGTSTHPAGVYCGGVGGEQICEVVIDLTLLDASEAILNDVAVLPANAWITKVEVQTVVAAATGTAIDVGLIDQDRSTEEDYDGLLAAFPTAQMNAVGETVKFYETHTEPTTMTGTGALVGQELTNASYISASRTDGTAFTAGKVKVRVWYVSKGIDVTG